MKPEHRIADVLRLVGLRLENAIEVGRCSTHLDANDLLEMLYAIADDLELPLCEREDGDPVTTTAIALLETRES